MGARRWVLGGALRVGGHVEDMSGFGRWVRWVLLAMTAAMGLALAITIWSGYRTAERACVSITKGHGETLIQAGHLMRYERGRELTSEDLREVVERNADLGLRYMAVVWRDGTVRIEAGEQSVGDSAAPMEVPTGPQSGAIQVGSRVRMFSGPLPPAGGDPRRGERGPGRQRGHREAEPPQGEPLPRDEAAPPPGEPRPWDGEGPPPGEPPPRDGEGPPPGEPPPRDGEGPPPGEPPPWDGAGPPPGEPPSRARRAPPKFVVEFEPVLANQVRAETRRTLFVGVGASIALAIAAIVVARILRQRDALALRAERDRRLSALGEMSAVLAHEIRNPLTSLKGHAQLLSEALPEHGREHARASRVVREAMRLEALTNNLLDFVRAGQVELRPVDPAELLIECVESLDPSRFDVDIDDAPSSWQLDPLKMQQALTNLLDNALKASQGRPRARARAGVRREGSALVFEVRDFGEGIPAGDEERIFEPFQTTRAQGTGLGLAVTRRIVELHKGSISARNHPEGGARFEVLIPQA